MGLADNPGTLLLSIPDNNAGAASFSSGAAASQNGSHSEEVHVTTLDDFHHAHGLEKVRLIKIDVEGYEPQVLAGGKEFLTAVKPDVIIFEELRKAEGVPRSISIVQSYGYDVFSMPRALLSVSLKPYLEGVFAHDFVAVHRSASAELRRKLRL